MKKYLLSLSCVCIALWVAAGNPAAHVSVVNDADHAQSMTANVETTTTIESQDEAESPQIICCSDNLIDRLGAVWNPLETSVDTSTPNSSNAPRTNFNLSLYGNQETFKVVYRGDVVIKGGSGRVRTPITPGNPGKPRTDESSGEVMSSLMTPSQGSSGVNVYIINGGDGRIVTPIDPRPNSPGNGKGKGLKTIAGQCAAFVNGPSSGNSANSSNDQLLMANPDVAKVTIDDVTSLIDTLLKSKVDNDENVSIESVTQLIDKLLTQ